LNPTVEEILSGEVIASLLHKWDGLSSGGGIDYKIMLKVTPLRTSYVYRASINSYFDEEGTTNYSFLEIKVPVFFIFSKWERIDLLDEEEELVSKFVEEYFAGLCKSKKQWNHDKYLRSN